MFFHFPGFLALARDGALMKLCLVAPLTMRMISHCVFRACVAERVKNYFPIFVGYFPVWLLKPRFVRMASIAEVQRGAGKITHAHGDYPGQPCVHVNLRRIQVGVPEAKT